MRIAHRIRETLICMYVGHNGSHQIGCQKSVITIPTTSLQKYTLISETLICSGLKMSKESKTAPAADIPTKSTSEPTSKKEKDTTETQTQPKSTQSTTTTPLSDDLFPNFTSLTINDNTTENPPKLEHKLLHRVDRYQSLQNQLQHTLRSSFIQLSKFKIQQLKSNITYDESEHDANKIISISETRKEDEGKWIIDLENTDSEFKPLRQVMPLPNFQLRDTTKQFENVLNSIVDVINKRNEVIEVLAKLEKRKKDQKKKLKVQAKKDPTN